MVAGEQWSTAGRIELDGRDMTDRERTRARLGVSRTYQRVRLISSLTVIDNVLVGVDHAARGELRVGEAERRRRAEAALIDVGSGTATTADVGSLTFGQRPLVEMARAIASRPRLVLLDEPSSGLNDGEIQELRRGGPRLHSTRVARLLVEHNLPLVRSLAEEIIALDRGALLAHGGTEEVFANPDFQRSYVGRGGAGMSLAVSGIHAGYGDLAGPAGRHLRGGTRRAARCSPGPTAPARRRCSRP